MVRHRVCRRAHRPPVGVARLMLADYFARALIVNGLAVAALGALLWVIA